MLGASRGSVHIKDEYTTIDSLENRVKILGKIIKHILFTKFGNEKLSREALEKNNIIMVNNWLDVQKELKFNTKI